MLQPLPANLVIGAEADQSVLKFHLGRWWPWCCLL